MNIVGKIARYARRILPFGKPATVEWWVPNPKDSDIYLVSYPKSGNTWMRYLMAYATWPELHDIDLVDMASYIPSFGLMHDHEVMKDERAPCNQLKHRIIKEHTRRNARAEPYVKRAIYVVRDGRDALVSYWHFCNQRDGTRITFSDFLEKSARPDHSYGPWREHVTGWMNSGIDAKLVVRYEDMLERPFGTLRQALDFAEIEASDEAVGNAIQRASFGEMKKLESTKGLNLQQLKNVTFLRSGKSGSWKETFQAGDMERFIKHHGAGVPELGYDW